MKISRNATATMIKDLKRHLPKYYLVYASPFKVTTNKNIITIDSNNITSTKEKYKWLEFMKDEIEKEGYTVTLIK